jgi:thiol-disulfide isomerase/thioredoxin
VKQRSHTCPPRLLWHVSGVVITVATLLALLLAGCTSPTEPETATTGDVTSAKAPQGIDLQALQELLTPTKGKVLVINFWATWCPPCVAEMPELASFYNDYQSKISFLALSLDDPDEINGAVQKFVQEKQIPFSVYVLLERDMNDISEIVKQELAGALPTTLVYDKNGNVQKMFEGAITREELEAVVKPLL